MNVMGGVAICFIEQLKSVRKGWTLEPLVVHPEHDLGLIAYLPCPPQTSPLEHFVEHQKPSRNAFIKVKLPKKPLRLVRLRINDGPRPRIGIAVFVANGWVQHQEPTYTGKSPRRYKPNRGDFPPEGHHALEIFDQIVRITDKQSKKQKPIIHHDFIDLSVPDNQTEAIEITAKLIEKSFKRGWRPSMIDLDAK